MHNGMPSEPCRTLVGEGKANFIYQWHEGLILRVSKRNVDPNVIVDYWNRTWKPRLGTWLPQIRAVDEGLEMPYIGYNGSIITEFKPKWLIQSPDAPRNAQQCRTCAIAMLRGQRRQWCPLDIAALDLSPMRLAKDDEELICAVILVLVEMQKQLTASVHQGPTQQFLDLMCLRDCTVILEKSRTDEKRVWIVDLDPKSPEKWSKWVQLERELEPFYQCKGPVCRLCRPHSSETEDTSVKPE